MPYTVYKVTNLVTQDFYIGVHKTDNPNDDYLGSGRVIREQVVHYGPENFQKVILHSFDKRKDAYRLEAELVNPLLGTPGCLNLHPGGHGGFGYINLKRLNNGGASRKAPEYHASLVRAGLVGADALRTKLSTDPEFRQAWAERSRKTLRERMNAPFTGHTHSATTRQAISATRKGQGTKRVGWRWFYHTETLESRLVPPDELSAYPAPTWSPGKKPPAPRKAVPYIPKPKQAAVICPKCLSPFRAVGRGNRKSNGTFCACIRDECIRRYEAGESPKSIMQALGVSSSTLYHWTDSVRQRKLHASIAQLA